MNKEPVLSTLKSLANIRIGTVLLLGFASGLPLALTGNTLQAWMTVEGVDLKTIGFFALVAQPYSYKFLWAPLLDRFVPPFLGRRRGWILLFQIGIVLSILGMSTSSPVEMPWIIAGLALVLAFCSASQDIVVDAYRTDVLPDRERGPGAAVYVTGYRMAMLVSGALALILADYMGWRPTFICMAAVMGFGILASITGPEPEEKVAPPATLKEAVVGPLKEFFSRPGAWGILILIVLYKLGDATAGLFTMSFLLGGPKIEGLGFTLVEVGAIYKVIVFAATIAGTLWGGVLVTRWGLYRSLMIFGILQAVSNLSFMGLAYAGKSYTVMVVAVTLENLAGGMGTVAFVAFLMALCDHRFTATQYALLSSLSALGRVYAGPPSGILAQNLVNQMGLPGWMPYFFITFLLALPGLALLKWMRPKVLKLEERANQVLTKN